MKKKQHFPLFISPFLDIQNKVVKMEWGQPLDCLKKCIFCSFILNSAKKSMSNIENLHIRI